MSARAVGGVAGRDRATGVSRQRAGRCDGRGGPVRVTGGPAGRASGDSAHHAASAGGGGSSSLRRHPLADQPSAEDAVHRGAPHQQGGQPTGYRLVYSSRRVGRGRRRVRIVRDGAAGRFGATAGAGAVAGTLAARAPGHAPAVAAVTVITVAAAATAAVLLTASTTIPAAGSAAVLRMCDGTLHGIAPARRRSCLQRSARAAVALAAIQSTYAARLAALAAVFAPVSGGRRALPRPISHALTLGWWPTHFCHRPEAAIPLIRCSHSAGEATR
eukprot:scaffold3944_cov111-Isochrysis_galbana.AAC.12